jgi:DNA-binding NarL/FixJ family response regulator
VTAPATPPILGRGDELEAVERVRAGGGVGVVIVGPPGVGKTRVARAALAAAQQAGAEALWVQGTRSAASIPLGALAGILPGRVDSDDPLTVMRTSAQALTERAGRRQLVLGVDDAQHLDQSSAALLLHLARASTAFLVVTVRTAAPCPDAVLALWKDAGAQRIGLGNLDRVRTEELLEALIGGTAEAGVRDWMWRLSRGNPLYVTELVRGLLADGALERDGVWRMTQRPSVPRPLRELIAARIGGLDPGVRRTLELLALGEPLRLSEFARVEPEESLVAAEAEELIALDESDSDPAVRLAQPLYGETIRAALPVLRARQIRLALAESLQHGAPLTPDGSLRVARWLMDAGETVPDRLLADAARAAIVTGAPELAGDLARRALERGGGLEPRLLLARSLAARNQFEEAAAALTDAEPLIADPEEAIAYLQLQAAVLHWGLNRAEELRGLLMRATTWWQEPSFQRQLDPLRDLIVAHLPREGATGGRPASTLSDATDSDLHRQRTVQTAQLRQLTYDARGREAYQLAAALHPEVPFRDVYDESSGALWVSVCVQAGEGWPALERWCERTLRAAVRHEDHSAAGIAALGLGNLRYAQGRYRQASRWLIEAQLHYERQDPLGLLVITQAAQVAVAAATGDAPTLRTALARCRAAVRGDPPPPNQLPFLRWALGWAAHADGDTDSAASILLESAAELASSPLDASLLAYEGLRAGAAPRAVAPVLEDLDARSDAQLISAAAIHAAGLADANGGALLDAAERMESIGALRYACEAAAHAASAFLMQGEDASARRAAAVSRRLFAEGEGAAAPPIDGLRGRGAELSAREAELASLAAQGLSNVEIAERLVLSVRTVETYIYRAMQKLGLSDRRGLGPALSPPSADRRVAS